MSYLKTAALSAALLVALVGTVAFAQGGDGRIVGCYVGTWANYRLGNGAFKIEDIDPNLCTHGFYGFADINNETFKIKAWDVWLDLSKEDCPNDPECCDLDAFRRFVALKEVNPNFVPMISVGGWTAGSAAFSEMAADPAKRTTFTQSCVEFCEQFGFGGVDFDWEYPSFFEGSSVEDKDNFSLLIAEMGAALKAKGLQFSAAVNAGFDKVKEAYDVPVLMEHFDFVNLMTYDYHGYWDDGRIDHRNFTGHNAPLITRTEENDPDHPGFKYNVFDGVQLWIEQGGIPEKLVLGIPLYGRGFMLENEMFDGSYCPANGPIPIGPISNMTGFWGYNEIAMFQSAAQLPDNLPGAEPLQWKITVDACYKAPYMSNGPYWIGYDDPTSAAYKAKFANAMNLGGAFVWSLDTDDFTGEFSQGVTYPVLRAINEALESGETFMPAHECIGTAANCVEDLPDNPLPDLCTEDGQFHEHPSSCHWYFRCDQQTDGSYEIQYFDCGDDMYDDNTLGCVYNPDLCPPDEDVDPSPGPGSQASASFSKIKRSEQAQGREVVEECRHVDWSM